MIDKTKPEETEEEVQDVPPHSDPSDNLSGAVDWEKDKKSDSKAAVPAEMQLAMADDGHRNPSPFKTEPKPGEQAKPGEQPKPADQTKPAEQPKPGDSAKATERVGDPSFLKELPTGALDANQRAYEALKSVKPGQPLTPEQRKTFDDALKDAGKLEPVWLQEQQKKLVEDVQSKDRVLSNGAVLPPWTPAKEKEFVEKLLGSQKAFNDLSPDAQKKVGEIEANINGLAPGDTIRRGVFQRMLTEEGNKDPKIKNFVEQKSQLDKFTTDNAAGLVRRNMHQQDMSVLHSKGVVSGIYAIALDKAGQPADQKQLETLLKDSIRDLFAPANIPELVGLMEKYKLEEKETKELEDKVPGRADLRKAQEIMADEKQGNAAERLEKARPFFEKAIGSSSVIDQQKTADEIEKVSKERNALGDNISAEKLNELDTKAVELVEQARLPYEARIKFALALQNASAEKKDDNLNAQAIGMLRSAEALDPAYKLDPVVQGALILAQKKPPESFDVKKAEEVGKPAVEQMKAELIKQGKMPDDRPVWLKALILGGEALVGVAAFHLIGKYIFGPMGTAKNYIRRSWELSSRLKGVEAESTPSLKAGEEPRLTYKNKEGNSMPVEGVRKSDGRLRVWNGEKTEVVKLGKGDSLYMKVPPDANLSKEQVKELAAKKLTPTGDENVINENRTRYEEEIKIRDREIAELKRAQEELQRQIGGKLEVQEVPKPENKPEEKLDKPGDTTGSEKGDPKDYEKLVKDGYMTSETAQKLADLPPESRKLVADYIAKRAANVEAAGLTAEKQKQAVEGVSKGSARLIEAAQTDLAKLAAYPEVFKSLSKPAFDGMLLDATKKALPTLDKATLALYNERLGQGYLNDGRVQMLLGQKPETREYLNDYIKNHPELMKTQALDTVLGLQDRIADISKIRELEKKAAGNDADALKELADARKRLNHPLEKLIGLPQGNEKIDATEQGNRKQAFERYLDLINKGELDGRGIRRLSAIDWGTRHTYEARLKDGFLHGADLQKLAMTEPSLRKMLDAGLGVKDGPLTRKALDQVLSLVPKTEKQEGEKFHEFFDRRHKAELEAAKVMEGIARSGKTFDATLKALDAGAIDAKDLSKLAVFNKETNKVEYDGAAMLKVLKSAERLDARTAELYQQRLNSGYMDGAALYKLASMDEASRKIVDGMISGEKPRLTGTGLKTLLELPPEGIKSLNPGSERFGKIADALSKGTLDRVSLEILSKMPESQRKAVDQIVSNAAEGKPSSKPVNELLWDKLTPELNVDSKVDANGWNQPAADRTGAKDTVADLIHKDAELKAILEKTQTGRELVKRLGNVRVTDTAGLNAEGKLPVVLPKDFAAIKSPTERANALVQALAKAEAENAKPTYKYGTPEWQRSHVPTQTERDLYQLMRERAFIDEMKLPQSEEAKGIETGWHKRFLEAEGKQVEGAQHFAVEFDAKSADPKAMAEYLSRMDAKTQRKFADLIKHLEGKQGPLVVDFGAGSGGVSAELAKMGIRAVPLDLSPEMVKFLQERRAAEGLNYYVLNKDSVRFFMGPNSFDAQFGSSELHEVGSYGNVGRGRYDMDSIKEAISQRVDTLKEGGVLVIRDFVRPADGKPLTIDLETARGTHLVKDFYENWQKSRKDNPNKTDLKAKFLVDGKEVPFEEFKTATAPNASPKVKASVVMDPASAMEFMISVKHPGSDSPNYKKQMQGVIDEQFCNLTQEQFEKAVKDAAPRGYEMRIVESQPSTSEEYKGFWDEHFTVKNAEGVPLKAEEMPKVKLSLVAVKVPEGASTLGELQASSGPAKPAPASVPAQQRPDRVVATADKLTGTDTRVNTDGTLERKEARPGEVLAREQLERRDLVDQKEIDVMKRSAEELAKSDKVEEREKAAALKRTVDALEGRLGAEAQREAHKAVLTESRSALERGEGGGYGRAVVGGLIGVGILTAAALAYYHSSLKAEEKKALERAKVR